jgi:hypothetical protein
MENDEWVRFGTAESVGIRFGQEAGMATISGDMYNLDLFDAQKGQFLESGSKHIGSYPIPSIPLKVKWLNLGDLLQYRRQPSLFPEIQRDAEILRKGIALASYYREITDQYLDTGQVVLADSDMRVTIQPGGIQPDPDDGRPLFVGGVTIVERRADGVTRKITCDTAHVLEAPEADKRSAPRVNVHANGSVSIVDSREPSKVIRRERERSGPLEVSAAALRQAQTYTDDALLAQTDTSLGMGPWVDKKRAQLVKEVGVLSRDITGVLHSRMAFAMSVFVLVILGAALGIVFRGAHVLTAFGISFVPSLFVITMIIAGKQLIDKPGFTTIGVAVAWLGILIVAAVDLFVMMKVVRR